MEALSYGVLNVLEAMLGHDDIVDPLGPNPDPEADMTNVLSQLIDLHLKIHNHLLDEINHQE